MLSPFLSDGRCSTIASAQASVRTAGRRESGGCLAVAPGIRHARLAAVEGPIALTELTLAFDNPEDRQLEGRFAITLPPGAAISFDVELLGIVSKAEPVTEGEDSK